MLCKEGSFKVRFVEGFRENLAVYCIVFYILVLWGK